MSPFLIPLKILFFLLMLCVPAVVLLLPLYWRARERARVLDLARKALDQGTALPPEILQLLPNARRSRPQHGISGEAPCSSPSALP